MWVWGIVLKILVYFFYLLLCCFVLIKTPNTKPR